MLGLKWEYRYNKINSIMREYASHFLDNCFVFDGQSFEKRKKKGKKKAINLSFYQKFKQAKLDSRWLWKLHSIRLLIILISFVNGSKANRYSFTDETKSAMYWREHYQLNCNIWQRQFVCRVRRDVSRSDALKIVFKEIKSRWISSKNNFYRIMG